MINYLRKGFISGDGELTNITWMSNGVHHRLYPIKEEFIQSSFHIYSRTFSMYRFEFKQSVGFYML